MPISSFALLLGVICYLFGFPLVFNSSAAMQWKKKVSKDDVLLRFVGAMFVVIAALCLRTQWYFTPDADGIVIVFAWIVLLKALMLTWWPETYMGWKMSIENKLMGSEAGQVIMGVVTVLVGAFFTYLGIVLI